jgi:hypothetical protein
MCRHLWCLLLGFVTLRITAALAFLQGSSRTTTKRSQRLPISQQAKTLQGESSKTSNDKIKLQIYKHKSFNLTYLYKEAAPGREKDRPIILIHPVGIGLSSWFWKRLMDSYEDNPPIYAPDLIGKILINSCNIFLHNIFSIHFSRLP